MFARLSVDTDAVRGYGRTSSSHAATLHDAASRLTDAAGGAAAFGPVGTRFLAALGRAAGDDAAAVTTLGGTLAAARDAALWSAHTYDGADARAASGIAL